MEGIESYILTIPDFNSLPASVKIDFFAYFLLIERKQEGVAPKDIERCFEALHLQPYSNVPAYLNGKSKGKNRKYLKKPGLYYLERAHKEELDSKFGVVPLPRLVDSNFLPIELFQEARGYVKSIAEQTITAYDVGLFDACSVLTRKLVEVLIIECFERHEIKSLIQKTDGSFYYLSDLITELVKEPKWTLGRNTKQALPKIKRNGDLSAHNRRYFARKPDIDKLRDELRVVIEELIHIVDYPSWK